MGGKDTKLEALAGVPLFAGLKKRELVELGRIADTVDLPAGKELITEGKPTSTFFVLLEGEATVRKNGRKKNVLGAGDFFGEIGLFSRRDATATVETSAPSRIVVITRPNFGRLLKEAPQLQLTVLTTLAERLLSD